MTFLSGFSPFADGVMAHFGSRAHEWSFWQISELLLRKRGTEEKFERLCFVRVEVEGFGPREAFFTPESSPSAAARSFFSTVFTPPAGPRVDVPLNKQGEVTQNSSYEGQILSKNTRGLLMAAPASF